jgi:hypothetical protein
MLKKMSTAIALGLVVALLSIPSASFAGNGKGPGDGIPNGDGIPDLLCEHGVVIDGVCYPELGGITTQGNFDVATGPNGPQTGDQDGVPDQDRLQDGSCLDEA